MIVQYPAHIRVLADGEQETQSCSRHCEAAAEYAKAALDSLGYGNAAFLAGILHDMGKWKAEFRRYIERAANGESVVRGSVIHSFAGSRYLLERFHQKGDSLDMNDLTAEIIAYAIGAHHGLFDVFDSNHRCGFTRRLTEIPAGDSEAVCNYLADCMSEAELSALFRSAADETAALVGKIKSMTDDADEKFFHLGLLTRLLTSAIIEGDRRDTAEFMSDAAYSKNADKELWTTLLCRLEDKLSAMPCESNINKARREISDACCSFADNPGGVYRLNVPTGGGKTLSALRYALSHAAKHGKKRIIFTFPLLSIIEQNCKVIREALGDDSLILEHHSDVVSTEKSAEDEIRYELLCESWEQPVIVTTSVMLLNAIFEAKTSSVRRFHSLSDSVIVIDEVQTVPHKMLTLFNLAVSFLAEICNATIVLCSATQPYDASLSHPIRKSTDIIPYSRRIWEVFKRTEIIDAGAMALGEIPGYIRTLMEANKSLLIVCNKKSEAAFLYSSLYGGDYRLFHLSASMCISHRKETVRRLFEALESGGNTICVSTQVIEAGVDISFGAVVRLTAGMDSVIQSAGRCNRNGESSGLCPVYIVRCVDEQLAMLADIRTAREATEELLIKFKRQPERYGGDLASEQSIMDYYDILFDKEKLKNDSHDYPVKASQPLFDMLSQNEAWIPEKPEEMQFCLCQAFQTAGGLFEVFDNAATEVIVPYGKGGEIISDLCSQRARLDIAFCKGLLRKAREYSVSLYSYQIKKLNEAGALISLCGGAALALREGYYDNLTGFQNTLQEVTGSCDTLIW